MRQQWRGLDAERLIDSPLIAVDSPNAARRLLGREAKALADEPLLGSPALWMRWFELAGLRVRVNPVAAFNDAGLMLQAAEQDMGLARARQLFAADALRDGRLVRLSSIVLPDMEAYAFWLVYPPTLRDWPPLTALRSWLHDEMARSQATMAGDNNILLRTRPGRARGGSPQARSGATTGTATQSRTRTRRT